MATANLSFPALVPPEQAAEMLGVSVGTLNVWRYVRDVTRLPTSRWVGECSTSFPIWKTSSLPAPSARPSDPIETHGARGGRVRGQYVGENPCTIVCKHRRGCKRPGRGETAAEQFMSLDPIKRKRRTKAEIEVIREAIYNLLAEDNPMTVRQVFYQISTKGLIEKTEGEYRNTVGKRLTLMRRAGESRIPGSPTKPDGCGSRGRTGRSNLCCGTRLRPTAAHCGMTRPCTSRCGSKRTHWPASSTT